VIKFKVIISENNLRELYLNQKLSSRQIAKKCNYGKTAILERMKLYGIKARTKSETSKMINHPIKYKIFPQQLRYFYFVKKLSINQIAKKYNCYPSVIFNKFLKYEIQRRNLSESVKLTNNSRCKNISKAVTKYSKKNFSGSFIEKAYLIGFRLGDLHIRKNKYGQTIYVQSWSTKIEQIKLMKKLFRNYGHVLITRRSDDDVGFTCYLNQSFNFLLKKEDNIENWIIENNDYFLSFLAGYIDAEGSFGVYNGYGSFFVGSYDKNIIHQIYEKLNSIGIKPQKPRICVKAGYVDKRGVTTHKDLFGFKIRRKEELRKFISLIKPYIKHEKRLRDLIKVNSIVNK
jgi:hypothetical protein